MFTIQVTASDHSQKPVEAHPLQGEATNEESLPPELLLRYPLVTLDGFFFVMGGRDKHKNLADFFVLDVRCLKNEMEDHHTLNWRRFFQLEAPKPRIHPLMTQVGGEFYYFGGVSFPENMGYNDFWQLRFGMRR